ncbi:MAG: hypothetical protein KAH38_08430, partial [Candidatus Hydrogenedentes bacterium]|nr:hypothetical protein [Candidatus Hydrogenedentota bacterium]
MKTIIGFKFTRVFAVALMLLVFSGCIKRTSTPIIEETTFRNITEKVIVSNPIGMVSLTGSNIRVFSSSVRVSKSVQTYSLLGLANPSKYLDNVLVYQSAENGELNVRVIVERL